MKPQHGRLRNVRGHGSRVRILRLIDSLGTGGGQRDLIHLCDNLDRRVFEQDVCALVGRPRSMLPEVERCGAHTFSVGVGRYDPRILPRLIRLLRSRRYDIVHTHVNAAALFGALASRFARNLPLVVTVDANLAQMSKCSFWLWYVLPARFASRIVVNDQSSMDELLDAGIRERKIRLIRHGNDYAQRVQKWWCEHTEEDLRRARTALGVREGELLVATACRLHPERKVEEFLRAFATAVCTLPHMRLAFVGDGPMLDALQNTARTLGVSDRVRFLGFVEHLVPIYLIMDLFLTISVSDYVGLAAREAMACGVPVLAYDIKSVDAGGDPAEVDGSLVFMKARNITSFTECLVRLVSDTRKRERLGQRGLEAIREWPTPRERALQHEQLYGELLGNGEGA